MRIGPGSASCPMSSWPRSRSSCLCCLHASRPTPDNESSCLCCLHASRPTPDNESEHVTTRFGACKCSSMSVPLQPMGSEPIYMCRQGTRTRACRASVPVVKDCHDCQGWCTRWHHPHGSHTASHTASHTHTQTRRQRLTRRWADVLLRLKAWLTQALLVRSN